MQVRVGVGVVIVINNRVLLGKRINSHVDSTWSFPGGHLEFWESWQDCAIREVKEETNLDIKNPFFLTATNDIFKKENKHYNTIFMLCDEVSWKLKNREKHKFEKFDWFEIDNLPRPLFLPIQNLFQKGKNILINTEKNKDCLGIFY